MVRIGQGQQPGAEGLAPGRIGAGQGQSQGKGQRLGAAGGQVRQVHRQGFVPEQARVDIGQKVAPLHQHVAGDGQLHAGAWCEQGAVVAHAQGAALHRALEKAPDQVEFTQRLLHKK